MTMRLLYGARIANTEMNQMDAACILTITFALLARQRTVTTMDELNLFLENFWSEHPVIFVLCLWFICNVIAGNCDKIEKSDPDE